MVPKRDAGVFTVRVWYARIAVSAVFALNVGCAASFLLDPGRYVAGFELEGVVGTTMVRGLGILFLMWNATYPPVMAHPERHRTLFGIVLVQQAIGLVGESWLWLTLPNGHAPLAATGARFIVFDAAGLVLMLLGYVLVGRMGHVVKTRPVVRR